MIDRGSYQAAQPLMQWGNLLSKTKGVRLLITPPCGKRGSLNCQKYPSALQKLMGRRQSWFKTPQSMAHYVSYFFTEQSFRQSKWSTEAHTRQPSPSCNEAICSATPNGCAFRSRYLVAKGDSSIAKNIRQLCRNRWRGWWRIFVAAWQIGRSQRGGRGCQPSCVGTWSERKKAFKYAYATPLGEQT